MVKRGPEAQLLASVLDALGYVRGVHVLRLNAGLTIVGQGASRRAIRGCEPGTPDLCAMLEGGRVVWLELKAPKGRLSPSQLAWHARATAMGHTVVVARDVQAAVDAVRLALRA